jgi:acyl dehydratase
MAIATKEIAAGQELPPVYKVIKLENMRLYTMWTNLNTHTDWEVAKKSGVPAPIAQGLMSHAYISQMCTSFFGESWFKTGSMDVRFVNYTVPGDRITVGGIVSERIVEGDAVRLKCDVWCENQTGDKTCVGTASALVY